MLVLRLKPGQKIHVGQTVITFVRKRGKEAVLGFEAPREVQIDREEVRKRKLKERAA